MNPRALVLFGVGLAIGYWLFGWPTTTASWRPDATRPAGDLPPGTGIIYWGF